MNPARLHSRAMEDPNLKTLLLEWHLRPDVLLVLVATAGAYAVGWWRLRRAGHRLIARGWRLLSYLSGLVFVAVALMSPIGYLAHQLFTAHMIQHILLIMVAAPLLLLGNPLPASLWGLPKGLRHSVGRLLVRGAFMRNAIWALTLMPVAWIAYVGNLWLWHLPVAYQAALRHHAVHDLEHLLFFGTAILFWWPIIEPAPRLHGLVHSAFGILYLIAATGQNTLLGALLALPERLIYPYYAEPPRLFGLTPLEDQALAGGIMWSMGHMYLIPLLLLVARILNRQEEANRRAEAIERRSVS